MAAVLVSRAIGKQLHCVFVDNGLLRKGERESVAAEFSEFDLTVVDASERFLAALDGVLVAPPQGAMYAFFGVQGVTDSLDQTAPLPTATPDRSYTASRDVNDLDGIRQHIDASHHAVAGGISKTYVLSSHCLLLEFLC